MTFTTASPVSSTCLSFTTCSIETNTTKDQDSVTGTNNIYKGKDLNYLNLSTVNIKRCCHKKEGWLRVTRIHQVTYLYCDTRNIVVFETSMQKVHELAILFVRPFSELRI